MDYFNDMNKKCERIIGFQKTSFENWYKAMMMVQEQTTSAFDNVGEQNSWIMEYVHKTVQGWLYFYQKELDRFKNYVEEGFSKEEEYIKSLISLLWLSTWLK